MKISWVFDVISPFAYLSLHQLPQLPAGTTVDYVPILFAALLDHHGQIGNAEIDSKRRFTYRFSLWRARQMNVPMRMPPAHPFNPLMGLRLIIAAGSDRHAVQTVFDAVFRDSRDVTDPAVIADLAQSLGIADAKSTLAEAGVKQTLRENTEWAISKGAFGVPTFVVGEEIFWGHDAFGMVVDYLRDPAGFNDAPMQAIDKLPIGVMRERAKRD